MALFSPPPKGKKVAPLPPVREETPMYYESPTSSGGLPYANRNMYRHAFPVNDPKNAAAAARRAAARASMANPDIPVHRPGAALGGAGAAGAGAGAAGAGAAGGRNNNTPAPRPKLIIRNNSGTRNVVRRLDVNRGAAASNGFVNVNLKGGSRRRRSVMRRRHITRRR
jgi:hypothetical protein